MFTVDYAESDVAEDPSQHKQSHVLILTDAGEWTGNVVALPNNRVRVTSPAYWETGEGAPDFRPSQWIHCAEQDDSYMNAEVTFDNLITRKTLFIPSPFPRREPITALGRCPVKTSGQTLN